MGASHEESLRRFSRISRFERPVHSWCRRASLCFRSYRNSSTCGSTAAKRTAFQEESRPDAGAVVDGEALDLDQAPGHRRASAFAMNRSCSSGRRLVKRTFQPQTRTCKLEQRSGCRWASRPERRKCNSSAGPIPPWPTGAGRRRGGWSYASAVGVPLEPGRRHRVRGWLRVDAADPPQHAPCLKCETLSSTAGFSPRYTSRVLSCPAPISLTPDLA